MSKFENNLSEGNVARQLIKFALPFLVSMLIQSLYNVADMLIVGNYSGTASMSGVNIGGQITLILTNIIVGLCTGGTVLVAQYLGSKQRERMQKTISTLVTGLLIAAVVITVVMLLIKDNLLHWIATPEGSFSEASSYLFVTVLGVVFIFGYNCLSAILRGMGDSKRPFIFVLIACLTNIGLDLLMVGVFDMRATGAAIATVISQGLSMFLCIFYLMRNKFIFDFNPKSFRIDRTQLRMILRIGTPTAVQNGIVSISFLLITAIVNITGGMYASAAVGAVSKINNFAILPAIAMSASVSAMSAQNIGAGKWDRARHTARIGMTIAICITVVIFAIVQIFPEQILSLFDGDPQTIAYGVPYIRSFSFDFLLVPFMFCFNGLFNGAGHTTFTLCNSAASSIPLRIPAAYLFGVGLNMGMSGIGLGAPVATLGALISVLVFFFTGKWKVNIVEKRMAKITRAES